MPQHSAAWTAYTVLLVMLMSWPMRAEPDGDAGLELSYAAPMERGLWQTSGDRLSCRLTHDIQYYGQAVFEARAGVGTQFTMLARHNPMQAGPAELVSQPPTWAPELPARQLGKANVMASKTAISLGDRMANTLLGELQKGMAPQFRSATWFDGGQSVDINISPRHFLAAYEKFTECASGLFARSFQQISRSRVHFDTDRHNINRRARLQLDEIIEYTRLDTSVKHFYIDGHTDDVHDHYYNIELSKRRARAVSAYLASKGIDKKRITTRYHGERYPVVANADAESRSKNRRVTVRLER